MTTFSGVLGVLALMMFLFQKSPSYLSDAHQLTTLPQRIRESTLQLWPATDESHRGLMAFPWLPEERGMIMGFHGKSGSALDRMKKESALTPLGYRLSLAGISQASSAWGLNGMQ